MQKLYVLLRQNQNNGPYNLEELLQFDLQPGDLIWIEGQSAGWYYPQEIAALRPHLSFLKASGRTPLVASSTAIHAQTGEAKKVFVSMPVAAAEAEPLSVPPAQVTYAPPRRPMPEPVAAQTEINSKQGVQNFNYQPKEANFTVPNQKPLLSAKKLAFACVVGGIAFGAFMGLRHTENKTQAAITTSNSNPPLSTFTEPTDPTLLPEETQLTRKENRVPQKQIDHKNKRLASVVALQKQQILLPQKNEAAEEVPVSNQQEKTTSTTQENTAEKTGEPTVTQVPNEKKKLRDKIVDLFKKEPAATEEAPRAEETEGERRTVRREADASLAQMVSIRLVIPNSWMMGVKGGKATLYNRSSQQVLKAVVDVFYYNDDDELLAKRTVSFAGIKGKDSQTISIPDHAEATRLDYKIISVQGKGNEPVARR